MRILIVHNRYQQLGGEDAVVKTEFDLLKNFGQDVRLYERSNDEIKGLNFFAKLDHLFHLGHSRHAYRELREVLREFKPDVVHFHNIFFMLTPSVYQACRDEGIPIVQSQHNFRPFCANGLFLRNNQVCEDCMTKSFFEGARHGCYRGSRVLSAFIAAMLTDHQKKKTWQGMVDAFIVGSEFTRQKFIRYAGIDPNKITIKPNCVFPDRSRREKGLGYALYVGRLSHEKGPQVLLEAFRSLPQIPLKIVGTGPLERTLKKEVERAKSTNVEFLGYLSGEDLERLIRQAMFLIIPSVCYENFPRIIPEAAGYGVPILASRLGSLAELIEDGKTGYLFEAGDTEDLKNKARQMFEHPEELRDMGDLIVRQYQDRYTSRKNYEFLTAVYASVVNETHGSR